MSKEVLFNLTKEFFDFCSEQPFEYCTGKIIDIELIEQNRMKIEFELSSHCDNTGGSLIYHTVLNYGNTSFLFEELIRSTFPYICTTEGVDFGKLIGKNCCFSMETKLSKNGFTYFNLRCLQIS